MKDRILADCRARLGFDLLANTWNAVVIYALADGPCRPRELRAAIGGISAKVLTETLRRLEGHALVTRRVHAESPPRVEYALTDLGVTLLPTHHGTRPLVRRARRRLRRRAGLGRPGLKRSAREPPRLHGLHERRPRAGTDDERGPVRDLGVTNGDDAGEVAGDFDAVTSVAVAVAALTPHRFAQVAQATLRGLRTALAAHGITLPSLGRDFGTPPLVILGNCDIATARTLTAALREAAGR